MSIAPNATIVRSTEPVETEVGLEIVLMSVASGECIGLGETGSSVWRLLAQPTTLGAVVASLAQEYDAPADVIESDVAALLDQLARRNLIEVTA